MPIYGNPEQPSVRTEGGAGVEMGCKAVCRCAPGMGQLKEAKY